MKVSELFTTNVTQITENADLSQQTLEYVDYAAQKIAVLIVQKNVADAKQQRINGEQRKTHGVDPQTVNNYVNNYLQQNNFNERVLKWVKEIQDFESQRG